MNRTLMFWVGLVALFLLAPSALAQTTTTQEQPDEAMAESRAFITIDLEVGFPLDPLIVSLNGGGDVSATIYGESCVGYVAPNPTVSLEWTGDTDFVEAFFYSDHDPVLVVETPAGEYLCNDDANSLLLDPVIELNNPEHGSYRIWVGSHAPNQLIPGMLVLTTRPEVNIGTFTLDNLISREPIPEDLVEAHEVNTTQLLTQTAELAAVAVEWDSEEEITHTVTVSGTVPAFDISTPGRLCNGFVHTLPDFVLNLSDVPDDLRIFFEGDGDATLVVQDPDGIIHCNDDYVAGDTLNPVVDILDPLAGQYYVFIGRVQIDEEISGVLTVSGSVALNPAILKGDE